MLLDENYAPQTLNAIFPVKLYLSEKNHSGKDAKNKKWTYISEGSNRQIKYPIPHYKATGGKNSVETL